MKLLIVLGLASVAFSASVPTYDFSNWIATEGVAAYNRHARIINGQVVVPNSRPFQAGVLTSLPGGFTGLCGGSILSANRVLTAAHCWFDGTNQGISVRVLLGAHEILVAHNEHTAQVFDTNDVLLHPLYEPALARRDIAIIRLPTPATINNYVQTVNLPVNFGTETFAGHTATISGWGVIENNQGIAQHLREVQTPVITNQICGFAFPFLLQPDNICTSGLGTVGACNGDSGGPVTIATDHGPVVIGVVSFGSLLGCEANLPSVHARVQSFLDFILPEIA